MQLRKADMNRDMNKIVALCKLCLAQSLVWCSKERFLDHVNNPMFNHEYCFVAEKGSDILGYIEGSQVDPIKEGVIQIVAVHPEHRNKGIGTKLVGILENEFKKHGLVKVGAGIDASTHVKPFYLEQGYTDFCSIEGFEKDFRKVKFREITKEDFKKATKLHDYVFGTQLTRQHLELQLSNPSLNLRYVAITNNLVIGFTIGSLHDGVGEISRIYFGEGYKSAVYDLIFMVNNLLRERNSQTLFLYAPKEDEDLLMKLGFSKVVTTEVVKKRLE